jgi:hypothetical protein
MKSITQYGEVILKLSDFVKPLDQTVRAEAFKFLLARELGQETAETLSADAFTHPRAQARTVAAQELIRQSNASSFAEKAIVLGYWLEQYQQKPTFSSADLRAAFEQAREQSAKNPSDLVAKLESTARLMKAEKVGGVQHYRLTSTAIDEVEAKISRGEER